MVAAGRAGLGTGLEILRETARSSFPSGCLIRRCWPRSRAVLARHPLPKTPEAGARREMLRRWFWCAVFGQAYESAPNSQSAKDVTALSEWLTGKLPPEVVTSFKFDPEGAP